MNFLPCTLEGQNVARVDGVTIPWIRKRPPSGPKAAGLELGIRPMHLEVHAGRRRRGAGNGQIRGRPGQLQNSDPPLQRPHPAGPRAREGHRFRKTGLAEVSPPMDQTVCRRTAGQIKGGSHGKMGRQQGMVPGAAGFCRRGLQRHHPLMTVVNYSIQDIFGPGNAVFVGTEWFKEMLTDNRLHDALGASFFSPAWSC
jgi:hypothetical protein